MPLRILPSTGAFIGRVNGRDHHPLLSVIDSIPAEAYEFMMYESFYGREDAVLADFLATGLSFPVLHVEKRIGELVADPAADPEEPYRRFRTNCEAAVRLGAEKLVLHLWNGVASDRDFDRHLAAYPRFRALAEAYGLCLTVENVVCAVRDPLACLFELLALYPDAAITYDTKMAAFHRQEYTVFEDACRPLWQGMIRHIHLNDYAGIPGDFSRLSVLHLGEGNLDIPRISRALLSKGYCDTVTLECSCMCPDGSLTPEKMNASLALARNLLCGGRKE